MNKNHLENNTETFGFSHALIWLKGAMGIFLQQVGLFNGLVIFFILIGIMLNLMLGGFSHLALIVLSPFVSAASLWVADGQLKEKGAINQRLGELFKPHASSLLALGSCYLLLALVLGVLEGVVFNYIGIDFQSYTIENPAPLSITFLSMVVSLVLYLPLYLATFFAPALIVFKQHKPIPALRLSAAAALQNWRPLLAYNLIIIIAVVIPITIFAVVISLLADTSALRSLITLLAGFFLIAAIIFITALTWIVSYVSFIDIFKLHKSDDAPETTLSEF